MPNQTNQTPQISSDLLAFRDQSSSLGGSISLASAPLTGAGIAAQSAYGASSLRVKYSMGRPKPAPRPVYGSSSIPIKYSLAEPIREQKEGPDVLCRASADIDEYLADCQTAFEQILGFDGANYIESLDEVADLTCNALIDVDPNITPTESAEIQSKEIAPIQVQVESMESALDIPTLAQAPIPLVPSAQSHLQLPSAAPAVRRSARDKFLRKSVRRTDIAMPAAPEMEVQMAHPTVVETEDASTQFVPGTLETPTPSKRKNIGTKIAYLLCNPPKFLRPATLYLAILPTVVVVNYGYEQTHDTLAKLISTQEENKKLKALLAEMKQSNTAAPVVVAAAPMPPVDMPVMERPVLPLPMASSQPLERTSGPVRMMRAAMPAATKVNPIDLTTDEPIAEKNDIPAAGKFTYITQDNKPVQSKFKLVEGK